MGHHANFFVMNKYCIDQPLLEFFLNDMSINYRDYMMELNTCNFPFYDILYNIVYRFIRNAWVITDYISGYCYNLLLFQLLSDVEI